MTKKSRPSLFKIFGLSALLASALTAGALAYFLYEPPVGGDFALTHRGQAWTFSNHAEDLNLLYIGYAKCPDVCPMALSYAGYAFKNLEASELARVRLMFLSVDHQHDLPDDVANYAAQFFPTFLGLSGTAEQIDRTVAQFRASYMVEENPNSYLGYSISHSDRLYFLNKKGIVVQTLQSPRSHDEILKTIRENL